MNVLVTGNNGYIGSVLTEELARAGHRVTGYDTDFYRRTELCPLPRTGRQIVKDVRRIVPQDCAGIDAVIHLAALSNDPLGQLDTRLTEEINLQGTLRVAACAKEAGVRRFLYASSQSMYGVALTDEELDEDASEKHPITAYARTKWDAECGLKRLGDPSFTVVCFRPSTVFGASPRLRCDIVYNNLVACAYTTGQIQIKSDGTPWRPVVHVRDVSAAFLAGLAAPAKLVAGRSYNVGIPHGNFTVKDLAEAAGRSVPGSTITFTGEHGPDSRTYRVSFARILSELGEYYRPQWDLDRGGAELVAFFRKVGLTEEMFRGERCNRLPRISMLLKQKELDEDLFWQD